MDSSYICNPAKKSQKTSVKSKRFITKVMFLAAVGVPRYDNHRESYFDGKIGVWPFVETGDAIWSSCNRPKGTSITKLVNVDKRIYQEFLIKHLFPAIRNKFPQSSGKVVEIQHDNAKPHACWNNMGASKRSKT